MKTTHLGLAALASAALVAAACATATGPADVSDAGVDGGACPQFDLQTDVKHCGSCTKACAST
jgi:predicted small secreted protein